MRARAALVGRREEGLLALPSVRRVVDVLGRRCRDISWVRTSVASLDRFATLVGNGDLEALLARAQADRSVASAALEAYAGALRNANHAQIAALSIGPKLWFTFNGVEVDWSPQARGVGSPQLFGNASDAERLVLLTLVGSGLHRSELLRLRVCDVGSLDRDGELVPNIDADPLAVRFTSVRGARTYVTFFADRARDAVRTELIRRREAGEALGPESPLVLVRARGGRDTSVARASRFNTALIEAGNNVNVDLCVATGKFFRAWGPPGARFEAAHAADGGAQ